MRFQGVSPDSLSRFRSPSRAEDQIFSQYFTGIGDGDGAPPQSKTNEGKSNVAGGNGSGGDMLLQWGQRKRSSRTDSRQAVGVTSTTDDSSSSSSTHFHGIKKVHRRVVVMVDKQKKPSISGGTHTNTNANTMPPPPPSLVPCSTSNGRGNHKPPCAKDSIAISPNWRNSEERSGGGNGSPPSHSGRPISPRSRVGKRSPTPKEKYDNTNNPKINNNPSSSGSASLRNEKLKNGLNSIHHHQEPSPLITVNDHIIHSSAQTQVGPEAGVTDHDDNGKTGKETVNGAGSDGVAGSVYVWPRIYIPLTRKEKEEDFLAMKGTKLPHRPKKRPKAVERVLQYCYPGMWLGDVTSARYEVKEKKSGKKRRRGLKGMESMESDSDQ